LEEGEVEVDLDFGTEDLDDDLEDGPEGADLEDG
jgi:hypothetical protein